MKFEEKIICMSLSGFIFNQNGDEKKKCINKIKNNYGKKIAKVVEKYTK